MKSEPLTKTKMFYIQETFDGELVIIKAVKVIDVKSAVELLLKEIEKRIRELDEYEKMGFTKQFCANRRDEIRTYIIPLIKKTFEGVIE